MSARLALSAALGLFATSAAAPVQCGQNNPDMRLEDDAGESLWTLATKFEKEGNHASAVETWRFLADQYPANRHAAEARRLAGEAPSAKGAVIDGG